MRGKRPGTLSRFVCRQCGTPEYVTGGNCAFRCSACREPRSAQYLAHKAVADAIHRGELRHPAGFACEDCGGAAIEYDHRDYSQPLKVAPVCRRCNLRRGPALNWKPKRSDKHEHAS